jgi:hypothetical protein
LGESTSSEAPYCTIFFIRLLLNLFSVRILPSDTFSMCSLLNIKDKFYTHTRNIKIIMFLGSKVRRVRKADSLTAIYEPTV